MGSKTDIIFSELEEEIGFVNGMAAPTSCATVGR